MLIGDTDTRWVVVGTHGLYTDQCLTRTDAISNHVWSFFEGYPERPDEKERAKLWRQCRNRGDRVIKAKIDWEYET